MHVFFLPRQKYKGPLAQKCEKLHSFSIKPYSPHLNHKKLKMSRNSNFGIHCAIFQNDGIFRNLVFFTIAPKVLHSNQRNQVQRIRLIERIIVVVLALLCYSEKRVFQSRKMYLLL